MPNQTTIELAIVLRYNEVSWKQAELAHRSISLWCWSPNWVRRLHCDRYLCWEPSARTVPCKIVTWTLDAPVIDTVRVNGRVCAIPEASRGEGVYCCRSVEWGPLSRRDEVPKQIAVAICRHGGVHLREPPLRGRFERQERAPNQYSPPRSNTPYFLSLCAHTIFFNIYVNILWSLKPNLSKLNSK